MLLLLAAAWPVPASANTRSQQLYGKALIPFNAQRWAEAQVLLDEAAAADPDDAVVAYYRGLTNARLGFPDKAIADLEQALALRPDLSGAVLDLGILYFQTGQYPLAEEWLQRAHQQPANRFAAAFYLGLVRLRTGDPKGAQPYFAEAAKDPALRSSAQYYQALALMRDGESSEARTLLAEVQSGPADAETTQIAKQYLASGAPGLVGSEEPAWEVHGTTGFGYDSNVMLAPDSSSLARNYNTDPSVGGASLNTKGEQDGFFRIGAGAKYRLYAGDSGTGVVGYDLYQSVHFESSGNDLQSHRVHLTMTSPQMNQFLQFGVTGMYDFNLLNYRGYYQGGRGTPWMTFFEGQVGATQIYYSFSGQDFLGGNDPNSPNYSPRQFNSNPFDPFRDAFNNAFGVRQYFLLGAADRYMSFGYQWDDNDPTSNDGTDFAYMDNLFDVRFDFGVLDWGRGTVGYLFDLQTYEHPNSRTGFTKRRHDGQNQIVLRFERPLTSFLSANLEYLGVFNGSNIPDFEYNRNIVQANVWLHF
ncbi:MAG: tetratricopeptide repeat protein [Candidatus Binatia bacterium]